MSSLGGVAARTATVPLSSQVTLVTGGAGFIGSHLCEALLARGDRVVCLDSFDPFYDPTRKERNIAGLLDDSCFQLVRGDLRDGAALQQTVRAHGVTRIIGLAARAGVRPSLLQPADYFEVNVTGTVNLLEAARASGITTVVLASSSSVYGANTKVPFAEADAVESPVSPYAASKRAMEVAASVWARLYNMDIACLRFFTVYGPRQRPDMAISKFVRAALAGEAITLFGEGDTRRDYTFVADIVQGIIEAAEHAPGAGFQLYNLGNESAVTLREMVEAVGRATEQPLHLAYAAPQAGDVEVTCADITKARQRLGYQPRTALDEGLRAYVAWLRAGEL